MKKKGSKTATVAVCKMLTNKTIQDDFSSFIEKFLCYFKYNLYEAVF